jgi:hypothetical protein|tara:strand:+ start:515 stop:1057 length:543 start_codon:yes stop_codon:yes gene_type:complete
MATLTPNITVAMDGTTTSLNNVNLLQPTAFKLVIDHKYFSNVEFFCQTILHPSVTLTAVELPFRRTNIALAGDKLTFGDLTAIIIVDENLNSYIEMFNWMNRLVENKDKSSYDTIFTSTPPTFSDITISILSSHNNQTRRIRYIDAIPSSIGDLSLESTAGDVQQITFPITFRFTSFEIV